MVRFARTVAMPTPSAFARWRARLLALAFTSARVQGAVHRSSGNYLRLGPPQFQSGPHLVTRSVHKQRRSAASEGWWGALAGCSNGSPPANDYNTHIKFYGKERGWRCLVSPGRPKHCRKNLAPREGHEPETSRLRATTRELNHQVLPQMPLIGLRQLHHHSVLRCGLRRRRQCGSRRLAPNGWGSTKRRSWRRASSRREQPPLPTLAGFELIAEDVASHDGSLSTFR
jgi:hypothetical protein